MCDIYRMFPYGLPNWLDRARHAVLLLEFSDRLTLDDKLGSFHMCNVDRTSFGSTFKNELKIINMSQVKTLQNFIKKLCHFV